MNRNTRRPKQEFSSSMIEVLRFTQGGGLVDAVRLATLARQARPDLSWSIFELLVSVQRFAIAVPLARNLTNFEHILKKRYPAEIWSGIKDHEASLTYLMEKLDESVDAVPFIAAVAHVADPDILARCIVENLDPNKPNRVKVSLALTPRMCDICDVCNPSQFAILASFAYGMPFEKDRESVQSLTRFQTNDQDAMSSSFSRVWKDGLQPRRGCRQALESSRSCPL